MLSVYPHVPLFENQGLGVALLSYAGNLYWGVTGDWDQVPDLHHFSKAIVESFSELCDAAGVRPAVATPAKRPRLVSRPPAAVTVSPKAGARRRKMVGGKHPTSPDSGNGFAALPVSRNL
jgi:hypothetical protein